MRSPAELPIDEQSAAYARPQGQQDDVLQARGRSGQSLAEHGGVAIVLEDDRHAQRLLQDRPQRDGNEGKIRRSDHFAPGAINGAGAR